MSNMFALLSNSEGEAEEVNLGSLYIKHDERGLISHIEIEPYSSEDLDDYEPHFDGFDSEFPEVPLRVHLEAREASIEGFFSQGDITTVDFEEFGEGPDEAGFDQACECYELILRSAYRLYERVRREEPVFVGYVDIETHRQLDLREILDVRLPQRRLPMQKRRELIKNRRRAEGIEAGRNLCRITLKPVAEDSNEFPNEMVLHVGLNLNGFPLRFVPISGLTDAKRPIAIMENGDVRFGDTEGAFTNFMASKMVKGEAVILWKDRCRKSQVFCIVDVEKFHVVDTATAE